MNYASDWWISCLVLGAIVAAPAVAADGDGAAGDRIFAGEAPVQLHLTMTEKQFAALAPAGGGQFAFLGSGPRKPPPENAQRNTFGVDLPWSQGTLAWDGRSFQDVGVRYKGNYTYMASARSLKKSLKIDLNRNVKGQTLDGLTMLSLHCGVSDPSQAREALSYAFLRDAGVPASRTTFAELTLTVPGKYDRELVGVFTLVEQVNKRFLKRHFGDGSGMLLKPEGLLGGPSYLGATWKAYADRYHPEGTPTDAQQQRLIDFSKLVSQASDETFALEVGTYLDVEAFLKFIAANTLLSNLDSYLAYGHNYYLYLVPESNRFVFIPWDLDLSLATWPAAGTPEQLVELSIHHPHAGQNTLIDRLFAIPEHKQRYLAIVEDLTATKFTSEHLLDSLERIEQTLNPLLANEAKAVAGRNEKRGGGFGGPFGGGGGGQYGQSMPPRRFIQQRTESVAAQLAGRTKGFEPKPLGAGFGRPPGGGARPPR